MRTNYCGLISEQYLDQTVTVKGWVHRDEKHHDGRPIGRLSLHVARQRVRIRRIRKYRRNEI